MDMEEAGKTLQVSFEELAHQCGTGRAYLISGTGRNRKYGYRRGVLTKRGDIEIGEWCRMMFALIDQSGERALFEQLKCWVKQHTYFLKTRQEIEEYTLRLHSNRIFENPKWVGYEEFNRKYCFVGDSCGDKQDRSRLKRQREKELSPEI